MHRILYLLPIAIIGFISVILIIQINKNSSQNQNLDLFGESPLIGKSLDLKASLDSIDDPSKQIQLNHQKYTILNFFASWCVSCLYEHKIFLDIKTKIANGDDENIQLIGINWRDNRQDALDWLATHQNPYHQVGLDDLGKFGIRAGIKGLPETFLVNPQGVILLHKRGNIQDDFYPKIIDAIKQDQADNP